jgi:hypothetical protein
VVVTKAVAVTKVAVTKVVAEFAGLEMHQQLQPQPFLQHPKFQQLLK